MRNLKKCHILRFLVLVLNYRERKWMMSYSILFIYFYIFLLFVKTTFTYALKIILYFTLFFKNSF